jgi:hypothetical protein
MTTGEPVPLRVAAEPRPEGVASVPGTAATAPAHPRLPSRALPEAYNAHGEPVELPPLPHDPPVTEDPHGQPVGTPQARPLPDSPPTPKASNLAQANGASGKVTVELRGVTISTPQGQVEAEQLTLQMDLPRGLKLDTTQPGSLVVQAVHDPEPQVVDWAPARAPAATHAAPVPPVVPAVANEPVAPCPTACPERGELPECPFAADNAPPVDREVSAASHLPPPVPAEPVTARRLRIPLGRGTLEFRVHVSRQPVPSSGD